MKTKRGSPPLKFPLTIGERMLGIRIAANLNQKDLAEKLHCTQGTISKIETSGHELTMFQLSKLREHFGISADAFIADHLDFMTIAVRFSNYSFTLESMYKELGKIPDSEETAASDDTDTQEDNTGAQ